MYSHYIPLRDSETAYNQAITFERELEYEKAIEQYSLVIPSDSENYEIACKKIPELTNEIILSKKAAYTFLVLRFDGVASSFSDLTQFEISPNDVRATCQANGIPYSVSIEAPYSDNEYVFADIEPITGLYLAKYKALPTWNGWLTNTTNDIRQGISELYFSNEDDLTFPNLFNEELVEKYIDLFDSKKDLSIFDDAKLPLNEVSN